MENEQENKETNVKATIDAVTGLVKAVPVYQDTVQPAAKQIGQSLETVTKTVNIALAPIKAIVWGYEKIEEFISTKVSDKLKNVPKENIITPPPQVAGPTVEALRYAGHDESLRELYANLLATAMDKETSKKAHPGFVEIIKNMTSDEALLIQAFIKQDSYPLINIEASMQEVDGGYQLMLSNYSHLHKIVSIAMPDLIPSYLDNLCRLGILEVPSGKSIIEDSSYEQLENDKALDEIKKYIQEEMDRIVDFERRVITLTEFGKLFVENVVNEKN